MTLRSCPSSTLTRRSDPQENRYFWYTDPDNEDKIYTPAELLNTVVTGVSKVPVIAYTDRSVERLYIDPGEPIRFRVSDIEWKDIKPIIKAPQFDADGNLPQGEEEEPLDKAGYKVMVTIAESGLGIISWWNSAEAVEGEEMAE